MVIKGNANDFTTVLKVASIALLDGLGIISLHQKPGRAAIMITLLGLWALIAVIRNHTIVILGGITTALYIACINTTTKSQTEQKKNTGVR